MDPGLSDHSLIVGRLDEKAEMKRQIMQMVRCIRECSVEKLVADLSSAPWQVMDSLDDMDSKWHYWKKLFSEIVDTHIPLKKARVRRKSLPWITREIRVLMRARNYLCTKAKKNRKAEDWEQYKKLRNQVMEKLNFFCCRANSKE